MPSHELTTMYTAKAVEYLIAVSYLLLFIPYWRFVNGGPAARARVPARKAASAPLFSDWFQLPAPLFFHPGHAWARVDSPDTVTIGIDDFARRLVGPVSALRLPEPGETISQGERGWSLVADSKAIDMLSPVDGTVLAVNTGAVSSPEVVHKAPYDAGWLMKVRSPRLAANLKQLLSGSLARSWIDGATDALRRQAGPELGVVYEDGGVLVDGIAHGLDPANWDDVVRRFLLTAEGGSDA